MTPPTAWAHLPNAAHIDALRVLIDVAAPPVCHQAALLLPWAVVREAT